MRAFDASLSVPDDAPVRGVNSDGSIGTGTSVGRRRSRRFVEAAAPGLRSRVHCYLAGCRSGRRARLGCSRPSGGIGASRYVPLQDRHADLESTSSTPLLAGERSIRASADPALALVYLRHRCVGRHGTPDGALLGHQPAWLAMILALVLVVLALFLARTTYMLPRMWRGDWHYAHMDPNHVPPVWVWGKPLWQGWLRLATRSA